MKEIHGLCSVLISPCDLLDDEYGIHGLTVREVPFISAAGASKKRCLGCVSKEKNCNLRVDFSSGQAENCRNSCAISRIWNAELMEKTPEMLLRNP